MKWALAAAAVALVVGALLLVSMGANDGCLPWQTPSDRPGWSDETECR